MWILAARRRDNEPLPALVVGLACRSFPCGGDERTYREEFCFNMNLAGEP